MMPKKVLIIEDNLISLQLMTYLLETAGFSIFSALDGQEGLELAGKKPDLIICDVHLPGVDGYQVAAALKAQPALAETPLVAVTALAMVGDREKLLKGGFDFYISKPIEPETFAAQITALVEKVRG
ncbi:MAG: response regulator [Eubacteriales bacterium]|nr:response regulator [Eubacteriales bacterium]